jgi:HUS1 checkpoint protein
MKLAKKNDQAVLSFEISGLTRLGRRVRVVHDVRIDVMRPGDVDKLSEPLCPEPDVIINYLSTREIFDAFF